MKTHAFIVALVAIHVTAFAQQKNIFTTSADIGTAKGTTTYIAENQQYQLSGAGENVWFNHDDFHFTYKQLKGDFILQARAVFEGKGTEAHRKLGWMIRKDLTPGSATVLAAVHGDGLTSLQYRKAANDTMLETQSSVKGPDMIQLERRGGKFIMSIAHFGEPYTEIATSDVDLGDEVYAGLFICSHNNAVTEKATFDNVRIIIPAKDDFMAYKEYIGSHIETLDINNGSRQILYTAPGSLQAPNWMKDGKSLIYNSNGLMYKLALDKVVSAPEVLNTGSVKENNNDHVISFDGKMLGLSSAAHGQPASMVWTMPVKGGEPKQITPTGPSYLHGWSPDGKYLVFVGQRNNEFDIYRVPSGGGKEERLTNTPGLDDGCEYSPDGKYIYFNSVRTGTMQLWRMLADGSNPEQLTDDEYNNWFPHISPDGKWITFISFMKDVSPSDHPFYKHVYLRLMPADGSAKPKVIAYVYGGQGTMNTPSWSPDSKKIAFVSNSN